MGEAFDRGASELAANGIEDARLEAEVLLRHALGLNRVDLYIGLDRNLTPEQIDAFSAFIKRRICREPTAYITGHREFFGLDFQITRSVLIPRHETELLVEKAIEVVNTFFTEACLIVDVGTGCGSVAIALARNLRQARIYAIDVSSAVLEIASSNCHLHGVADRVTLLKGNLLDPLPEPVHLIVANLPYVREGELSELSAEISKFEPALALNGGVDGLVTIKELLSQAGSNLLPEGMILLEIGYDQAKAVCDLARTHLPGSKVSVTKDLGGLDRAVNIRKGP